MKNHQTIWESAKRPLYVRSIWIESERHRHFILDYDSNRNYNDLQHIKLKKKPVKQSVSCDHFDDAESVSADSLKLIGSPKKQCQQLAVVKPVKLSITKNKPSFPPENLLLNMFKRHKDDEDYTRPISGSKRNSLQEFSIGSNQFVDTPTSDERLAERVLNWLDLAGKTPLIRPNTASVDTSSSPMKPPPTQASAVSSKKEKPLVPKIRNKTAVEKRPDSVKHITIIFNKEGMPVRYNRPLRYADLFRNGFTASKKFANSLTSRYGRNVYSTTPSSSSFENHHHQMTNGKSISDNIQKNPKIRVDNTGNNFTNDYKPIINKQILQESCNLYEAKKQLHIFMPSLPKKTLPTAAVTPSDCTSLLSAVLSDQFK